MEFLEALEYRHSCRDVFKPDPMQDADLRKIAEAGVHAPSDCNSKTTYFCIVNDLKEYLS